ncbi:hypothetical protein Hanom_Chr06g00553711 [Helianthus anomalus]
MNTYLCFVLVGAVKSSSKSASQFGMGDIQGIISPRTIQKELAVGQSQPEAKGTTTRARAGAGTKRKKPCEASGDTPQIEQ